MTTHKIIMDQNTCEALTNAIERISNDNFEYKAEVEVLEKPVSGGATEKLTTIVIEKIARS